VVGGQASHGPTAVHCSPQRYPDPLASFDGQSPREKEGLRGKREQKGRGNVVSGGDIVYTV